MNGGIFHPSTTTWTSARGMLTLNTFSFSLYAPFIPVICSIFAVSSLAPAATAVVTNRQDIKQLLMILDMVISYARFCFVHSGSVTVRTLPFCATRITAAGLWFLRTGVIENTVPGYFFCA